MKQRLRSVRVWLCCIASVLITVARAAAPLGLPSDTEDPGRALAQLGSRIFTDKRLSIDGSMSCSTCHVTDRSFMDGLVTARGLRGQSLTRNTPSLVNVRFEKRLFWDGRATDLVAQIRSPLLGPKEHALPDERAAADIVRRDPAYVSEFQRILGVNGHDLSFREVAMALVAYERTLLAGNSPFDRYLYGHDLKAMTPAAVRGLGLFRDKAQCESCHRIGETFALFTDSDFHASPIGLPESVLSQLGTLAARVAALRSKQDEIGLNSLIASDPNVGALGRFVVTLDPKDIGRFKTPSLRNVSLTGPYMHDGSVATLSSAIELELYSRSEQNYPLVLTEDERADLLQFLNALSSP